MHGDRAAQAIPTNARTHASSSCTPHAHHMHTTCAQARTRTHAHAHTHAHTHTRAHAHTHTRTHAHHKHTTSTHICTPHTHHLHITCTHICTADKHIGTTHARHVHTTCIQAGTAHAHATAHIIRFMDTHIRTRTHTHLTQPRHPPRSWTAGPWKARRHWSQTPQTRSRCLGGRRRPWGCAAPGDAAR